MKRLSSALLVVAFSAAPSHASGINLSWNDCGTFGQNLATFACNSNTGANPLVVSFVSPLPLTQLVGIELTMDVAFNQPTVPSWWSFNSTTGCRPNGLVGDMNFVSGPFNCADLWQGSAVGGVAYQLGVPSPDRLRVRAIAAVPQQSPVTVDNVTEYYAFRFILSHPKSTGAGSCAGCADPACLLLTNLKLVQPVGIGDYLLTQPISNTLVGWQCPAINGAPAPQCFSCPVPSSRQSWGTIKGLYR